jgi:hypothetical protein
VISQTKARPSNFWLHWAPALSVLHTSPAQLARSHARRLDPYPAQAANGRPRPRKYLAVPQPQPQMSADTGVEPAARGGRSELGIISIADAVVSKIAARAAAENPDAGAAVARMLGRTVPGAGHLGLRGTDVKALPKTSVDVDGPKRS